MQISIDIPELYTQEEVLDDVEAPNTGALNLNVKVLQYLGLSHLDGPRSWAHRIGCLCSKWVVVNAFYAGLIALPMESYFGWEDKYIVIVNAGHIAYCLLTASKLLTLMLQQKRIRAIITKFDQMYEREEAGDEFQKNVLFRTKRISNFMTVFATVCSLGNTLSVCGMAIPKALSTKMLFLRVPFPLIDMTSFPGFPLTVIYWLSIHIVNIGFNSVCDSFYLVLFFHVTAHFKILHHKLESYYEQADANTQTGARNDSPDPESSTQNMIIHRTKNNNSVQQQQQQETSRKLTPSLSEPTGANVGSRRRSECRVTGGRPTLRSRRSRRTLETRGTGSTVRSGRIGQTGGQKETREMSSYTSENMFNGGVLQQDNAIVDRNTNMPVSLPNSIQSDSNEISSCTESNWSVACRTLRPVNRTPCLAKSTPIIDHLKQDHIHLAMNRLIAENVKYHHEIEGQIRDIMDVFKYMLEVQVLINVVGVSTAAAWLFDENDVDYRTVVLLLLCVALQVELVLFCLLADIVTEQSDQIRDSVYRSNWIHATKGNKWSLLITMSRANKPLELSAGRIAILNLVLFGKVMKLAFDNYTRIRELTGQT